MTPLTKEQAEALATRLVEAAHNFKAKAKNFAKQEQYAPALGMGTAATVVEAMAEHVRNGTFIEVQP